MSALSFDYVVPGDDFTQAGAASSDVKRKLKKIGYDADVIRRVAIAMYEGEINMVIHAGGGTAHVEIDSDKIYVILEDHGPGIKDLSKAMQEGWSTAPDSVREMGFGAGMGLPNMKRNSDNFEISSKKGEGTYIKMQLALA